MTKLEEKTTEQLIEMALEGFIKSKNNSRENLQIALELFFNNYEGDLSRNNGIFQKIMKNLKEERGKVLLWIKRYTTLVGCDKDYSHLKSSVTEEVVAKGITFTVHRIMFNDKYEGQKWYSQKADPKTEYTQEELEKAIKALKTKCEKYGLDWKQYLK